MKMPMPLLFCAAIFSMVVAVAGDVSAEAIRPADPERGHAVALRWCAGCHAVPGAAMQTDQAPSFQSIVSRRNAAEVRAFLFEPRHPMPPLRLSNQDAEDVATYLDTLRPAPKP
jgi:mono/diheme cytochrome c family protein